MTDIKDLGPLDYRVAITDTSGRPSPEFQRRWNTQRVNNGIFVSTTGTPTIGALAYFSGNASITSSNLSGDISTTNTLVTTLATVNANVGTFGDATHTSQITLNAKGLATAAVSVAIPNFTSSTAGFAPASGGGTTNFLRADGTWAVAGAGTVTSVGLNLPATFTVSGSPVTGSGTLTAVYATQSANTIFAGPTTGAAAAPTFRAMVTADIPNSIVTLAKVANAASNNKYLGAGSAGSGAAYTENTFTAGTGISITNGASGITISATSAAPPPPRTILQRTTNQSIPDAGSGTAVSWNTTAVQDDVGAFSGASPTILTVPTGYTHVRITVYVCWAFNSTGSRGVNWRKNGAVMAGVQWVPSNESPQLFTTRWETVAVGDQLSVFAFQTSGGGALNLVGTPNFFTEPPYVQVEWAA